MPSKTAADANLEDSSKERKTLGLFRRIKAENKGKNTPSPASPWKTWGDVPKHIQKEFKRVLSAFCLSCMNRQAAEMITSYCTEDSGA